MVRGARTRRRDRRHHRRATITNCCSPSGRERTAGSAPPHIAPARRSRASALHREPDVHRSDVPRRCRRSRAVPQGLSLPTLRHIRASRATSRNDDSPHAQASSAAGSTRCCTSTTRPSARPPRSRSACSSASRRFSALHTLLARGVRVPAEPESRRGAARRVLEPAVDHRAVLRASSRWPARRLRATELPPGFKAQIASLFERFCISRRVLAPADHDSETAAACRTRSDRLLGALVLSAIAYPLALAFVTSRRRIHDIMHQHHK